MASARVAAGGTRRGLILERSLLNASTALRCSHEGRAAELTAFASLSPFKHLRPEC